MARAALIGFGLIPLIEIALFVVVGRWIGVWATLGLVILAVLAGSMILRNRGLRAVSLRRFNGMQPVAEEALIAVAAVLLILPGFLTDVVALLLLIPPLRRALVAAIAARMTIRSAGFRAHAGDQVIDGDYVDLETPPDPDPRPAIGRSGWTRH